jgi:hypothetical protein
MRAVYAAVLTVQYATWSIYIASIGGVYLLGFIVDTINIRWWLIPETLIVVAVSVVLSLVVLVMFAVRLRRGEIPTSHWLGVIGALPSMLIVCAALFYFLQRTFA